MAIQMRRGNSVDFDPSKMVPGEWAVSMDNEKLYICYSQGRVVEIGTIGAILQYIYDSEAWAVGTKNGVPVSNTDEQYENNSKYYAEQAEYWAQQSQTVASLTQAQIDALKALL